MAQLFYDENDPRKKREMRGDKTPMDMPQKVAGVVGFPHSNVRIDTGVNTVSYTHLTLPTINWV